MNNPIQPIQPIPGMQGDPMKTPNPSKISKNVLLIFVGVIIFISVIFAVVIYATSGVSKAGEEFLLMLGKGEIETAYESTSADFKEAGDVEDFKVYVENSPILSDLEKVSFNSLNVSGDTGSTRGTITGKDGQVSEVLVDYVMENDEWKVSNINFNPPPEVNDDVEDIDVDFMNDF